MVILYTSYDSQFWFTPLSGLCFEELIAALLLLSTTGFQIIYCIIHTNSVFI